MSDIYERQATLFIITDQQVAIVGCGGVGSWIALYLAMAGVERLHLFDSDTVDIHNLNRLPLPPAMIGRVKSDALAEVIQGLRSGIDVTAHSNFDPDMPEHEKILHHCNWIACSTDSLKSRRLVYNSVKGVTQYIEAGAEGHGWSVSFSPAEWATPDEDRAGYQSVPVFVGPCTLAASIVAYHVLLGKPLAMEYSFVGGWEQHTGVEFHRIEENEQYESGDFNEEVADEQESETRETRTGEAAG